MRYVRIAGACLVAATLVPAPAVLVAQTPAVITGERTSVVSSIESTAQIMAREDDPGTAAAALTLGAGSSFTAIRFSETSTFPPDGSAAAGTSQFIAIANGRLRSFLKSGVPDGVLNAKTTTFFDSVRGIGGTFGGRIRFDRNAGRWFIVMATDSVPGRIVIASSNGPIITAATLWSFTAFDDTFLGTDCTTDGPSLGIDPSALYIGANQFCSGGTTFRGSSAWVVRKASVVDGASAVVTAFHDLTAGVSGAGPYAPQGVTNDNPAIPYGYFLAVDNAAFGRLVLRRVSNPGGTPTISANINIAVAPTALPVPVRHGGNTGGANGYLSANDDRLASVYMTGSSAWLAHTIGVDETGSAAGAVTRNGIRWYEIGSLDGTPAVLQSGTLNDSGSPGSVNARNYFNGSIATSQLGRTIVGFSAAGATEFINAGLADRVATDPAGTLTSPALSTSSNAAYNPAGDPGSASGRRWGTYSDTVTDGCDGTTVWSLQQFADATNSYALQATKVQGRLPPTPVSASPSTVQAGLTSINVVVTGAAGASNGAFVNAPAGFACVASASIPGVVVNSVTVNSATQVTLNISTVNATAGLKPITIANPDGQTATGASLLSVIGGSGTPPIGAVDTPIAGSTAAGEMGMTGWAVSDASVHDVAIYRSPVAGEGNDPVFIGHAVFSPGARPDVQAQFPSYPGSDAAGWGYMVLTNVLPNQGNGVFTFYAYATNYAGQTTLLGARTVTLANTTSLAPFGSIDTPGQGEIVSGTIVNWGWALAKAGRTIPFDGSTIDVYIDNVMVGHPIYGGFRADIATLFPGLANSNGAVGYFVLDTRTLADGIHTIAWIIRDDAGQASGVGSRYFTVRNGS
jgi:hypothetical protein